ncbi:hypothetical protein TWF696_004757 [Orbilia brochopaga]|uniref:Uncharacterized protein n=1 Tax=Orbilia brochopaga TaxID=3140254 RepID=A0AAV9UZK5_9PEZI
MCAYSPDALNGTSILNPKNRTTGVDLSYAPRALYYRGDQNLAMIDGKPRAPRFFIRAANSTTMRLNSITFSWPIRMDFDLNRFKIRRAQSIVIRAILPPGHSSAQAFHTVLTIKQPPVATGATALPYKGYTARTTVLPPVPVVASSQLGTALPQTPTAPWISRDTMSASSGAVSMRSSTMPTSRNATMTYSARSSFTTISSRILLRRTAVTTSTSTEAMLSHTQTHTPTISPVASGTRHSSGSMSSAASSHSLRSSTMASGTVSPHPPTGATMPTPSAVRMSQISASPSMPPSAMSRSPSSVASMPASPTLYLIYHGVPDPRVQARYEFPTNGTKMWDGIIGLEISAYSSVVDENEELVTAGKGQNPTKGSNMGHQQLETGEFFLKELNITTVAGPEGCASK